MTSIGKQLSPLFCWVSKCIHLVRCIPTYIKIQLSDLFFISNRTNIFLIYLNVSFILLSSYIFLSNTFVKISQVLYYICVSVYRILGICSTSKLIAERTDFKQPAKLDVSGPTAWWPYLRSVHPAWVIWTDGDAALFYSCGKYLEDGSCNPHHTYR